MKNRICFLIGLMTLSVHISLGQLFVEKPVFTRADTLRGMLTPLRTCYDVTYYHLDLVIDTASRSVAGSVLIQFKVVDDFDRMQIDLFDNLKIEKILFKNKPASFTREFNAVFIQLPEKLKKNANEEITVYYSGSPVIAKNPPWNGGFTWTRDQSGNLWIAVTCQGFGASCWWPNKDHQSDEPDSMMISITVPKGLEDVSNGRLRKRTDVKNGTRFDWAVAAPINNYCVTFNVGKFSHFGDTYKSADGSLLTCDYYVMPYNLEKAKKQFKQVQTMLAAFEKYFGKYPFYRDGYKLIESPHLGMEHQTAVAYGNQFLQGYKGFSSSPEGVMFDFIIIHESAHEWWGNSVTSKDLADMWIHESFGAYAEALYVESRWGYEAGQRYQNSKKQQIGNKKPILGEYNVNHEGSGDMYPKGSMMLNTLRHVIHNDSLWFEILRGIQDKYKYQTVTTEDLIQFVNSKTGSDYKYLFDQYLRYPKIPVLFLFLNQRGTDLQVDYRWQADVKTFHMPVRVTTSKDKFEWIYPTAALQDMKLSNMSVDDFKAAESECYMDLKIIRTYFDPAGQWK